MFTLFDLFLGVEGGQVGPVGRFGNQLKLTKANLF